MLFAIVDIETLKEIDKAWEHRRRSNDGTKVIIHKNLLDDIRPMTMQLTYDEEGNEVEPPYPFPLVTGEELEKMPDFQSKEDDRQS